MHFWRVEESFQLSNPTTGQLVEHLLVELLVGFLAAHGEEDVTTDELVHNFAVGREAVEDDVLVVVKLDHHVLGFPIHIPCLQAWSMFSQNCIPLMYYS